MKHDIWRLEQAMRDLRPMEAEIERFYRGGAAEWGVDSRHRTGGVGKQDQYRLPLPGVRFWILGCGFWVEIWHNSNKSHSFRRTYGVYEKTQGIWLP